MSEHRTTARYFNGSDATRVDCICGWWDRWPGNDGSAEQSGAAHIARTSRGFRA